MIRFHTSRFFLFCGDTGSFCFFRRDAFSFEARFLFLLGLEACSFGFCCSDASGFGFCGACCRARGDFVPFAAAWAGRFGDLTTGGVTMSFAFPARDDCWSSALATALAGSFGDLTAVGVTVSFAFPGRGDCWEKAGVENVSAARGERQ